MSKVVAILGTLDSKGAEFAYLKEQIEARAVATLVIDVGIFNTPFFPPDITAEHVASAGGANLAELIERRDRGTAIAAMSRGAAVVVTKLAQEGRIDAVVSMGGGGGTAIATTAMRALPFGFPKLMVSTLASGDTRAYVGVKDIVMMPSVVDVAGINRISSQIFANAAGAIVGMVKGAASRVNLAARPVIAATMFGVTTPCVTRAREELEKAGWEVLVFHAVGTGGRTMEQLIRDGYIAGVLDLTTTELADELAGGILSAGADRLEAAGAMGIPQVVSAGALDMVNFAAPDTVPARYRNRVFHCHNPTVTLMRTTREENSTLGALIAHKLNKATGPTTFMIPRKGLSSISVQGMPFHDPDADAALFDALRTNLADHVRLIEVDTDINDPAFAVRAVQLLLESVGRGRQC